MSEEKEMDVPTIEDALVPQDLDLKTDQDQKMDQDDPKNDPDANADQNADDDDHKVDDVLSLSAELVANPAPVAADVKNEAGIDHFLANVGDDVSADAAGGSAADTAADTAADAATKEAKIEMKMEVEGGDDGVGSSSSGGGAAESLPKDEAESKSPSTANDGVMKAEAPISGAETVEASGSAAPVSVSAATIPAPTAPTPHRTSSSSPTPAASSSSSSSPVASPAAAPAESQASAPTPAPSAPTPVSAPSTTPSPSADTSVLHSQPSSQKTEPISTSTPQSEAAAKTDDAAAAAVNTAPDAAGASAATDAATFRSVLEFLRKNNLKAAEETLLKEAKLGKRVDEALEKDAADAGDAETKEEAETAASAAETSANLALYSSDSPAAVYETQYSLFERFVEDSLDAFRFEMALALYPLFVHMYLELVFNDHPDEAAGFFRRFSGRHEEFYPEDLKTLGAVTRKRHMMRSGALEHFRSGKFTIRMSRDTYQGLRRFLQENPLSKTLDIVQEHLYIDVYDGAPRTERQVKSMAGAMSGEAVRERNRVRVFHGLLREPELSVPLLEDDDEEEEKEPETKKKKKSKKDSMLVKKSKNDPNAPPTTRVPLPDPKEIDKVDRIIALRESAKRVKVDETHPVSICFYTLLNAHRGCTAIDVSDDSSLLATGFADSFVRVWSLTPRKLKTVKSAAELGQLDIEADDILERMLDERSATESKMLLGHSGPVYAVSISSDRQFLVSCSEDATIRLWSLVTFTNLIAYKGHNFAVWCVRFAPCGHYFASGGQDRTARLWSTDHPQPLRLFAGHMSDVDVVVFHPNCNYVASGSSDRTVRLWDVANGLCVRNFTGHKSPITALCFAPSGRHLASAGADGVVTLWNVANGHPQGWFENGEEENEKSGRRRGPVYALAFSRDGTALASGGLDKTVSLWNAERLCADGEDEGGGEAQQPHFDAAADYSLGRFKTKKTTVLGLHFTRRNLLLAFGPFSG